ncbi:MAG: DUF2585 family protein [bacterium]|nr:DUF2585 family protein [bacterium]
MHAVLEFLERTPLRWYFAIALGVLVVQAAVLYAMGQLPICECGYVKLWHGVVFSPENSQHIADWYTLSHFVHGVAFYFLLWLAVPKMPVGLRFLLALGIEAAWELFENTDFIINRYRETALALDYFGDSIVNSVADTVAMIIGFIFAHRTGVWVSLTLILMLELLALYFIRDNLLLNVINLLHPLEFIQSWQGAL